MPGVEYDFVDYLKGGINIALFVGIDFTASNKFPSDPASLHHIDVNNPNHLNPYQQVIKSVGEILLYYDTDKMVPVFGFGAKLNFPMLKSGSASHCFPCTGIRDSGGEEVRELQGIFLAYSNALQCIELDGPTYFAPVLKKIIANTQKAIEASEEHYSFFLLITDGVIHDMQETSDQIVIASNLPISIVIVGVGNEGRPASPRLRSDETARRGRTDQHQRR